MARTREELIAFEKRVAEAFERAEIKGPVHLSGGNEDALIDIFKYINEEDWVFSTYRNHYHALLHGIDPDWLFDQIKQGRSMNISAPRFFTSAIVGGTLSIAVGVAKVLFGSGRRVWCFVGDMAATTYSLFATCRGLPDPDGSPTSSTISASMESLMPSPSPLIIPLTPPSSPKFSSPDATL